MEKNYCVSPTMLMDCILMSMDKDYIWLAENLEISFPEVIALMNGSSPITLDIANKFDSATGFSASALLMQQEKYKSFKEGNH